MTTGTPRRRGRVATRKTRRLYIVLAGMAMLAISAALVLTAFQDSIVFFMMPSDVAENGYDPGRRVRIGGLVEPGSVEQDGAVTRFVVTDLSHTLPVTYTGILPDLFSEGQGVVAEGKFDDNGLFMATDVLAKHDENYMPKEVAEKLRESGRWQEGVVQ